MVQVRETSASSSASPNAELRREVENSIKVAEHGVVHRHSIRDVDTTGRKEQKRIEDEECAAGQLNPARHMDKYLKLQEVMGSLTETIQGAIAA